MAGTDSAHQNEKKTVQSLQLAWSPSSRGRGRGPRGLPEARLHLRQKSQCRNGTEAATPAGGRARSPVGRRRWRRSRDQPPEEHRGPFRRRGEQSKTKAVVQFVHCAAWIRSPSLRQPVLFRLAAAWERHTQRESTHQVGRGRRRAVSGPLPGPQQEQSPPPPLLLRAASEGDTCLHTRPDRPVETERDISMLACCCS